MSKQRTPLQGRAVFSIAAIAGTSEWACTVREEICLVSRCSATVLITGPSGTGKELIARSIHAAGDRQQQPFVPVDCAVAGRDLFASQLFGHEKGAFTGAIAETMGAFRSAHGGTLFLDELGELNVDLQAQLLRVLQERVVVPIGSLHEYPVDVRLVAATNRDLREEVAAGRFREDLFYRLNVVSIKTTPLAERSQDIQSLVPALQARLEVQHGIQPKPLSDAAYEALMRHDWPGNIRELNNVLERALLYCQSDRIELGHLPDSIKKAHGASSDKMDSGIASPRIDKPSKEEALPEWPTLAELERQHVLATLQRTNFNQTAAARLLAVDRHALRRTIRRLGIEVR